MDTETTLILERIATALEYFVERDRMAQIVREPYIKAQMRHDATLREIAASLPILPVIEELQEAHK